MRKRFQLGRAQLDARSVEFQPQKINARDVYGDIVLAQAVGDVHVHAASVTQQYHLSQKHYARREWASMLADSVNNQEADVRARLLADSGDALAADLIFRRDDLGHSQWRDDAGAAQGTLAGIADYYKSLRLHRLVVLGDAGAGKTMLGMQLLLDVLAEQAGAGIEKPLLVPVRLNLSGFDDPRITASGVSPGRVAELFSRWIVDEITAAHPLSRRKARDLVCEKWILPILDGLDEMDPEGTLPRRALAVIRALNDSAHVGRATVVVTCRASLYERLAAVTPSDVPDLRPGELPILQNATVVRLEPLAVERVQRHLIHRFGRARMPPPASPPADEMDCEPAPADPARRLVVAPRWQPVLSHLGEHPDSPFSTLLRSPLWLFVTIAAHLNQGSPAELIGLESAVIRERMLARLVPETVAQHRPPRGGWSASEVHQYLAVFAGHLAYRRAEGNGLSTGFRPHELWQLAGVRLPLLLTALVNGTLTVLLLFAALVGYHDATSYWIPPFAAGKALLVGGMLFVMWVYVYSYRSPGQLRSLDTTMLRTPSGKRRLLVSCVWPLAGLGLGYLFGLWFSQGYGDRVGQAYGISWVAIGFILAVETVLAHRPAAVRRPSLVMSQALLFQYTVLFSYGLFFALAFGGANWAAYPWHPTSFVDGAFLGSCIGLAIGVGRTCGAPGTRYAIAWALLTARNVLPRRRLGPFLDWAYHAGLLRLTGIAVQFRHHALQEWLGCRR